jgi:hypothetical protein
MLISAKTRIPSRLSTNCLPESACSARVPIPAYSEIFSSHDLHRSYVKLHDQARDHKKQYHTYAEKTWKGNRPMREPLEVEVNNFWNPQVRTVASSMRYWLLKLEQPSCPVCTLW